MSSQNAASDPSAAEVASSTPASDLQSIQRSARPTVFISGSAQGIGRATAEKFATQGYVVGVFDIDQQAAQWAAGDDRYIVGALDVTDPNSWEKALAAFTKATGGRLDILVNNAGILRAGLLVDHSYKELAMQTDINVNGMIYGCKAAHQYLLATTGAQLVNLSSASAIYGSSELAAYSATKYAARGLTEALDIEWRKDDIRVLGIFPLFVRTSMLDDVSTSGTRKLGVRLTPQDVAGEIYAVTRESKRMSPSIHFAVGWNAKLFLASSRFSPGWIQRWVSSTLVG